MSKKKNKVIVKVKTQGKRRIDFRNVYYFLKLLVVVFLSLFILGLAKDCSGLGGSCGGKDKGPGLWDKFVDWIQDIGDDLGDWFDDLGDSIRDWIDEHRIISPGDSNHQIDKDDPNGDHVDGGDNGGDGDGTGDDIGGGTTPKYNIYTVKCYITETPVEPAYFITTTKEKDGKLLEYPTAPTRDGYEFEYWKKYGDDTAPKGAIYDVHTEDTEYIAVFKEVDYSGSVVSFYLDVADIETDSIYFSAVTNKDGRITLFPENPPTRDDGYVFLCWQSVYEDEMTSVANIDIVYKVSTSYVALFVEPIPGEDDDNISSDNPGGDNTGGDNTGGDNTGGGNTGGDNTGGNTGGETPPEGGGGYTPPDDDGDDEEDPSDIRYNDDDYLEFDPTNPDPQIKEDFYEGRDESKFYISFYILEQDDGDFSEPPGPRYYCSSLSECYYKSVDIDGDGLHDGTGEPVRECNHKDYCHCTDIALDGDYPNFNELLSTLDGKCVIQDCYDNHREMYICENEGFACLTYGDGEFFIIGGRTLGGEFVAVDLFQPIFSGMVFEVLPFDDYVAPYNQ